MKIYFDNFCCHKFKARFSKRVFFAVEKRYFEKDLSNWTEILRICCSEWVLWDEHRTFPTIAFCQRDALKLMLVFMCQIKLAIILCVYNLFTNLYAYHSKLFVFVWKLLKWFLLIRSYLFSNKPWHRTAGGRLIQPVSSDSTVLGHNFFPRFWSFTEQCDKDFAVLGQFCAKIITLRL